MTYSFSPTRSMRRKSVNTTFWCRMMYLRSSLMFKGIAERAFENSWLNEEHSLNITKLDLISYCELPPNINSFSLKEICTNRWMVLLTVRLWDLTWQTPACIISRNNWKQKNKMPRESTNATLMIRLA